MFWIVLLMIFSVLAVGRIYRGRSTPRPSQARKIVLFVVFAFLSVALFNNARGLWSDINLTNRLPAAQVVPTELDAFNAVADIVGSKEVYVRAEVDGENVLEYGLAGQIVLLLSGVGSDKLTGVVTLPFMSDAELRMWYDNHIDESGVIVFRGDIYSGITDTDEFMRDVASLGIDMTSEPRFFAAWAGDRRENYAKDFSFLAKFVAVIAALWALSLIALVVDYRGRLRGQ